MRLRGIFRGFGLLFLTGLLAGCGWEPLSPPKAPPAQRVFLMYDNIGDWFDADVEEAGAAVAAGALGPGERVVVFHRNYKVEGRTGGAGSVVYEIVKDSSQSTGYRLEMLNIYEPGVNATLDVATINAVVGDIRSAVPASSYGLAFGSHGLGWIPRASSVSISRRDSGDRPTESAEHPFAELWRERANPMTRFFAGYNQKLDVTEFVEALSGREGKEKWLWDFIILDDCFMASVEALYDMRNLADYIIASPTEIMKDGFPYDRVVSTVFGDWGETGFVNVGRGFIDYYENRGGEYPCGTIAVVKTSELDNLAAAIRELGPGSYELTSVDGIQYYENMVRPGHLFFDLDDYLGTIRTEAQLTGFRAQLARTIVWKGHTERFYSDYGMGRHIPITHYSGFAVFIPWRGTASLIDWYRNTKWFEAVYGQ